MILVIIALARACPRLWYSILYHTKQKYFVPHETGKSSVKFKNLSLSNCPPKPPLKHLEQTLEEQGEGARRALNPF